MSESSESEPLIKRENINERVARLLATAPKLEFDNIDMEEDYTVTVDNALLYGRCASNLGTS
jgi:hypothetical protein